MYSIYIKNINLIVYILMIIIINIFIDILKYDYNKLIGLSVFPNNILLYKNKINSNLEYDFILNHELYHLMQYNNKLTNYSNIHNLEIEADNYSINLLKNKYNDKELEQLNMYLSKY